MSKGWPKDSLLLNPCSTSQCPLKTQDFEGEGAVEGWPKDSLSMSLHTLSHHLLWGVGRFQVWESREIEG